MKNFISSSIESITDTAKSVTDAYDTHIKEKAIKEVNKKIAEKGLVLDQITNEDYEAMISDLSKDIREDYAKKAAQGLLAFIGLDLLFGV
ncbi:MAG: hypothetical protein IE878_06990 [Epsilonproteobacteria bacterium]|nr:hypothetical protein [Campylobacterota bacterium]MBD3840109.1 hypothetical protein [Campylobacterota bacterium]